MNEFEFGKWSYSASCSTDDMDIWMIELKNGEKRWYTRFNNKKYIFLDALPDGCTDKGLLTEPVVYTLSMSI